MVEHRLAKARVASSNLVSRSKPPSGDSRVGYGGLERTWIHIVEAALPRRGTQVVRERSAKPLCAGSIPARASNTPLKISSFWCSSLSSWQVAFASVIREPAFSISANPRVVRTDRCFLSHATDATDVVPLAWDDGDPWRFILEMRGR